MILRNLIKYVYAIPNFLRYTRIISNPCWEPMFVLGKLHCFNSNNNYIAVVIANFDGRMWIVCSATRHHPPKHHPPPTAPLFLEWACPV